MSKNEFCCDCTLVHEDIVEQVKGKLNTEETNKKLSGFFKVLGDDTRAKIISILNVNEMCVCDIANLLGMTKSAVSHQLATLRKACFVKFRRDGKTVYYSLSDEHIKEILETALEHISEEAKG